MMSKEDMLFKAINYNMPIDFLIGQSIYEYDIQHANISALYDAGILDINSYKQLENTPKLEREKTIGLMIRKDKRVYEVIQDGIMYAKKKFCEINKVTSNDILAIKNDALFVINKSPWVTEIKGLNRGKYKFVQKNKFNGFIRINIPGFSNLELYNEIDMFRDINRVDVRGISDQKLELHKNYFLTVIEFFFKELQTKSSEEVIASLSDFYELYITRSLHIGYYREFNQDSAYRITSLGLGTFYINAPNAFDIGGIDISYNIRILQELYKIALALR